MNWLKKLLLYGIKETPQEEDIQLDNLMEDAENKLDRLEQLIDKVKTGPTSPVAIVNKQDNSVSVKWIKLPEDRDRPLHCAACGKELMFSNRYIYDVKTGEKIVRAIEADCPVEGADYKYLNIAEHAHYIWEGRKWLVNKNSHYFASSSSSVQFTAPYNTTGTWTNYFGTTRGTENR